MVWCTPDGEDVPKTELISDLVFGWVHENPSGLFHTVGGTSLVRRRDDGFDPVPSPIPHPSNPTLVPVTRQ
ncbi:MAG: hypothetical protein QOG80_3050 [Pseudonocardiales bacterium]|jgi:hypothetical protein|nr:hypothetical protein [Pseudonocardiales bacterium]